MSRLVVTNLQNSGIDAEEIKQHFSPIASVKEVTMTYKKTGSSKNSAFVTFRSRIGATKAIKKLRNSLIKNTRVKLKKCTYFNSNPYNCNYFDVNRSHNEMIKMVKDYEHFKHYQKAKHHIYSSQDNYEENDDTDSDNELDETESTNANDKPEMDDMISESSSILNDGNPQSEMDKQSNAKNSDTEIDEDRESTQSPDRSSISSTEIGNETTQPLDELVENNNPPQETFPENQPTSVLNEVFSNENIQQNQDHDAEFSNEPILACVGKMENREHTYKLDEILNITISSISEVGDDEHTDLDDSFNPPPHQHVPETNQPHEANPSTQDGPRESHATCDTYIPASDIIKNDLSYRDCIRHLKGKIPKSVPEASTTHIYLEPAVEPNRHINGGSGRKPPVVLDTDKILLQIIMSRALTYSRPLFYCRTSKNGQETLEWIDLVLIHQLSPRSRFIDFIRSLYLFSYTKYAALMRRAIALDGVDCSTLQNILSCCISRECVELVKEAKIRARIGL